MATRSAEIFAPRRGVALEFFEFHPDKSDMRVDGQLHCVFRYDNTTGGDVSYGGIGIAIHKWTGSEWLIHRYQHLYDGVLRPEGGPGPAGTGGEGEWKPDDAAIYALTPFLTFDDKAGQLSRCQDPTLIRDGFHMGSPVYVETGSGIVAGQVLESPPQPLDLEGEIALDGAIASFDLAATDPQTIARPARIKHTVWLLPPGTDEETMLDIAKARFHDKTAFTFSADVVHAIIEDGAAGSKCIVVDGHLWPSDIFAWLDERHIPYEKHAIAGVETVAENGDGATAADESGPAEEAPATPATPVEATPGRGGWPNLTPETFEPVFAQRDPQWGKELLGGYAESPETIGSWGCLGVSYAMQANFLGLTDETPAEFINGTLVRTKAMHKHFTQPGALATAFPDKIAYEGWLPKRDNRMVPRIKAYLDAGYPVPARVDFKPNTEREDQHWILLVGYEDDSWIMADPWWGRIMKVSDAYDISGQDILEALFYRFKDKPVLKDPVEAKPVTPVRASGGPYSGPALPVKPFRGLHGRSTRHPRPSDHEAFKRGNFNAIMVQSGISAGEIHGYGADFVLCRIFESFHGRTRSPADFVRDVENDVRQAFDAGVRHFFAGNEPNLDYENPTIDHGKAGLKTGKQYAEWLLEVHKLMRDKFPGIQLGWPALSPGGEGPISFGHDSGFREADATFMNAAKQTRIFLDCDFITCHAYYANWNDIGNAVNQVQGYRNTFPNKLVYVTESTNPTGPSPEDLGKQTKEFYRRCDSIPGVGIFFYLVSGPGWSISALVDDDGNDRGVIHHLLA